MFTNKLFYSVQIFIILQLSKVSSDRIIIRNDEFSVKVVKESLDSKGNYILSWDVNFPEKLITFEVEAATTGYVGFGISPNGDMVGADIFVGGVYSNGTTYGFDMHATGMTTPTPDSQSDWLLLEAYEEHSKTILKFSRLLNTCDDEDYPISNDTIRIIWAMGETDRLAYHKFNRGSKSLNLLMPIEPHFEPENYLKWDFISEVPLTNEESSYWCTIHKGPELLKTHHIVAFEAILENELANKHTHHLLVFKCIPPIGQYPDDVFGPFINHKGSHCYTPLINQPLPFQFCFTQPFFGLAKGGNRMIFPEGVGYPFPDAVDVPSYYMLEIHVDNPEGVEGFQFKTGGRILYTDNLRGIEAGAFIINHPFVSSLLIPPNQENYTISAQCGKECTKLGVTSVDGLHVFNTLFHAHLFARKMKLRHFRGDQELPWIDFDDHFDFNYQQNKHLRDTKQIFQDDHLVLECTYNTMWNNNTIVTGGQSTRNEMCQVTAWYYPKQELQFCISEYSLQHHFQDLGITNYTSAPSLIDAAQKFTVIEPAELAGDLETALNFKFNWTDDFVRSLEYKRRYHAQTSYCLTSNFKPIVGTVQFPIDAVIYEPENNCKT